MKFSKESIERLAYDFQLDMLKDVIKSFKRPKIVKEESKKESEKPIIDHQSLMILFNPNIPQNLKMNMIYVKMFEIVSKMILIIMLVPSRLKILWINLITQAKVLTICQYGKKIMRRKRENDSRAME